jgi:hypothetical protein
VAFNRAGTKGGIIASLSACLNQAADGIRAAVQQSLQTNDGIEPGCSRIYCALPKVRPY